MQLERLHSAKSSTAAFSYEDAVRTGTLAESFVIHPYWDRISKMLSGTIQAETEELLKNSEHEAVNRASVAICRKVLQMPFIDIEQGRMAEDFYQKSKARRGANRTGLSGEAH